MNEFERNQQVAERICKDLQWQGRAFQVGQCIALLDGKVVAVAEDLSSALQALRNMDPDPTRGMMFEAAPPTVDAIR